MLNRCRWAVRITHIPTGISVQRTSNDFRYEHQAKDAAMRYLKSRLCMLGNPPMKECELKFEEVNQPLEPRQ